VARSGRPRRELLVRLASLGPQPRVDVGADHGQVAKALGCIATEIQVVRTSRLSLPWVVADGVDCFRALGTVVIAGMGARTIGRILSRAPPIERAVLHAQDDPCALRVWLAENGWKITQEGLAPEAGRFAEVVVAVPGVETTTGLSLEYGPALLKSKDPLLVPHLRQLSQHLGRLAELSRPSPAAHARHAERLNFILERLESAITA